MAIKFNLLNLSTVKNATYSGYTGQPCYTTPCECGVHGALLGNGTPCESVIPLTLPHQGHPDLREETFAKVPSQKGLPLLGSHPGQGYLGNKTIVTKVPSLRVLPLLGISLRGKMASV